MNKGKIHDVDLFGAILSSANPNSNIGGIAGRNNANIDYVNVLGVGIAIPNVAGVWTAGGIAGLNTAAANIQHAEVTLSGIASMAPGGFIDLGLIAGRNSGMVQKSSVLLGVIIDNNSVATVGGAIGTNEYMGQVHQVQAVVVDGGLTGGVVGAVIGNNINYNPGQISNSYFDSTLFTGPGVGIGTSTGITDLPTATFTNGNLPSGYSANDWVTVPGFYPLLKQRDLFENTVVVVPTQTQPHVIVVDPTPQVVHQVQQLHEQQPNNPLPVLIALNQPNAPTGPGTTPGPGGTTRPLGQPFAPPQFTRTVMAFDGTRTSGLPPLNETRFIQTEIVLQMRIDLPPEVLARLAQQYGLTMLGTENLTALGRKAVRFRIGAGLSLRDLIPAIENNPNFIPTPNYVYIVKQAPAALPPTAAPDDSRGDPAQYILGKFRVHDVHRVASGVNVTIAVIDSQVDKDHSELAGTIAKHFDAVGTDVKAHSHGTAMIGAIVARDRLLGVAPKASILAVRSFSESQTTAEGTTFSILKGIEWAVSQGARVINMSFAGPYDPALEKALKAAYDKGVVLVAAAGNAGPKSPPLFPGADAHVIGVTATDENNQLFKGANRGPYVSVAAPGVEILAPAPQEAYQMSTGTSIATAHVSAVVALMIERDPTLKPDEVRKILQETATDLGAKGKDSEFGWGLVNPQRALAAVEARKKRPTATIRP